MKHIAHVSLPPDLYEILFSHQTIIRITKFCGDTQFPREVTFDGLHFETKKLVVDAVLKCLAENKHLYNEP